MTNTETEQRRIAMFAKRNDTKDLYDIVADKIQGYCQDTYYGNVIASFDQSYDGKEWEHEVEFASFENGDFETVVFNNDWCEGQSFIRNLKIWHLEDSEEVVYCKDCKYADEPPKEDEGFVACRKCSNWAAVFLTHPDDFCSWGERRANGEMKDDNSEKERKERL